jgi:cell division protein ZapA
MNKHHLTYIFGLEFTPDRAQMEENAPISIAVILAGKPFRLNVQPEEEETVRAAAKAVNDRLSQFQLQYPRADRQDALILVALQFAREALTARQALQDDVDTMQDLTGFLDAILNEATMSAP